ncbi:MAG: type I-E CRISPR-associated protein Cse1/CasA [bacterium]|nr:type I-E CRISPR-associated protein Cse1/CasA [bacterium]
MSGSFNLIDKKWIPCVFQDKRDELGLQETLTRADEIREVHDASPLVTVSLHRLLLAILHRVFGPENPSKWRKLWAIRSFAGGELESYFTKWRSHFDLFDEKYPFYQDSALGRKLNHDENLAAKWRNPIPKLFHELASGNNPTLFDHTSNNSENGISFAIAARGLVALQCYALSGIASGEGEDGKSHPNNAPLARGITHLVRGDTLFQTLMLNLVVYNPADDEPIVCFDHDVPAWELKPEKLWELRQPVGYLDYLTWQSRRVWLFRDEVGLRVTGVAITEGNNFAKDSDLRDPFMVHKKDIKAKKNEPAWLAQKFRPQRAMWRDITILLQKTGVEKARPRVIDHIATVIKEDIRLGLDAFGLANYEKAGKVNFWRHERLPLPAEYLENGFVFDVLQRCLYAAEDTGDAIKSSHRRLACYLEMANLSNKEKDAFLEKVGCGERLTKKEQTNLEKINMRVATFNSESVFWTTLEVPFKSLLLRLPDAVANATAEEVEIPMWSEFVQQTAINALDRTILDLGMSPRNIQAAVKAREQLQRRLAKS